MRTDKNDKIVVLVALQVALHKLTNAIHSEGHVTLPNPVRNRLSKTDNSFDIPVPTIT